VRPHFALVIDTRASRNLKTHKTEQQFICHYLAFQQYVAVIPAPLPHCKPFTLPSLTTQALAYLSDISCHRRYFVKSACAAAVNLWELESSFLHNSQILTVTDLNQVLAKLRLTNLLLTETKQQELSKSF